MIETEDIIVRPTLATTLFKYHRVKSFIDSGWCLDSLVTPDALCSYKHMPLSVSLLPSMIY